MESGRTGKCSKPAKLTSLRPYIKPQAVDRVGLTAWWVPIHLAQKKETLFFLEFFVLFTKPLDSTCCVDQFLFTRKKRMAFGTNLH